MRYGYVKLCPDQGPGQGRIRVAVHHEPVRLAVDREQQAKSLVAAFQCARQNWQPWIGAMVVIYIPDPHWTQQDEQYWWSITNPDGTPRPAYTALKNFFATGS